MDARIQALPFDPPHSTATMLAMHVGLCWALEVRFEPVAANIYAYIGDTGTRTAQNQGPRANIGTSSVWTGS